MKLWVLLAFLAGCAWSADDDLKLRTVLQPSPNSSKGLSQDVRPADCASQSGSGDIFNRGLEPGVIDTPQLALSYSASSATVRPGRLITLIVEFEPKPGMHIYAPGAEHYTPIEWQLAESKAWSSVPFKFPTPRLLNLPAINETAPVFDKLTRLSRDITISRALETAPFQTASCLVIDGSFRYQACDSKECYFPKSLPLRWTFRKE